MPDPRTFLVKSCPPAYLDKGAAFNSNTTNLRRDFFNSIGKIGDIEALNDIGASSIANGMRVLASTSNSIRTGCGILPNIIGNTLDSGANWVLENIGIAPVAIQALKGFHPEVANIAYGNAKNIFERVQQGHFTINDIPYYLQDFQNLESLISGIYTPQNGDTSSFLTEACEASPYAIDLLSRAPKSKFLFVVQFVFNDGYKAMDDFDFSFLVYQSSRPNIKYNKEDINHYGYISPLITKTEFEDMTMSFYDDDLNHSMMLYTNYLKSNTPITNFQTPEELKVFSSQGGLNNLGATTFIDESGIEGINYHPSTIGARINPDDESMLSEIKLFHLYDYGKYMNVYRFLNPKITTLELDDLDMSESDKTLVKIQFAYDSVYIAANQSFRDGEFANIVKDSQARTAVYPLRYVDSNSATTGPNNYGFNPLPPVNPGRVGAGCDL